MGELLIRRREMVSPNASPDVPTPVYELQEPVSTEEYSTGWLPFDTPKSFTILCEAYCSNRNWNPYGVNVVIFGIGTGVTLRVGNAAGYNYYENGVKTGTNKLPYTALIFNNAMSADPDEDTLKCCSLYARDANTTKNIKRIAVRYTNDTCLCEAFCARSEAYHAPNSFWWNLHATPSYPDSPIKLNWNTGNSCTINVFRAYESLLTDEQINDFLNGVT